MLLQAETPHLCKVIHVMQAPLRGWPGQQLRLQKEQHTVEGECVDVHARAGSLAAIVAHDLHLTHNMRIIPPTICAYCACECARPKAIMQHTLSSISKTSGVTMLDIII